MERAPAHVTRRVLAREIVKDAMVRPLNIAVGAAVLAAGFEFDAVWLLPLALVVYAAMVIATALDGDRAERVGRRTYAKRKQLRAAGTALGQYRSPGVRGDVAAARREEARLRKALDESPLGLDDAAAEVDRLMDALAQLARSADRLERYLAEEDEAEIRRRLERLREVRDDPAVARVNADTAAALDEQLRARAQVERHVEHFSAQIQHIAASLGAMHAQVLRMSVEEQAGAQRRLADEVRALRGEVGTTADALEEAFGDVE